jgi:hypothetical protein
MRICTRRCRLFWQQGPGSIGSVMSVLSSRILPSTVRTTSRLRVKHWLRRIELRSRISVRSCVPGSKARQGLAHAMNLDDERRHRRPRVSGAALDTRSLEFASVQSWPRIAPAVKAVVWKLT